MSQQTAVEWLIDKIKKDSNIRLRGLNLDELEEQAKQMEKEQLNKARLDGINLANKGYGK